MRFLVSLFLLLNSFFSFAEDNPKSFPENNILFKNMRLNIQANVLQNVQLNDLQIKEDFYFGNSLSAGLEFVYDYKENLYYGIGIFYQLPVTIDSIRGSLGFLPVYAFIDLPLLENKQFPILFSAQFGYAFLLAKDGYQKINNGIYHAFGITTVISKNLQLKFLYAHNYGKLKLYSTEYSLRKENLTFGIYYKF